MIPSQQYKYFVNLTECARLCQYGFMFRRALLLLSWFPISIVVLIINFSMLQSYSVAKANIEHPLSANPPVEITFQLSAPGGTAQVLSSTIEAGDSRVLLLESFLRQHKSPIAPHANTIVAEADRFGLDFRLLPAIAMCESNAGKRMPKKDEYNAFGIAVYTGQLHGKAFDSWPHAISWVSQYVKERYYDKGITDLRDVGAIWAPPSVHTGYSWTNCVESFMAKII